MKRSRSALAPASFEALSRVRRALREQAATPATLHQAPHKPKPQANGAVLFRRAVADAVPLPPSNRADIARPRPKPIARQRLRDEQQVMVDALSDPWDWEAAVSSGEELVFVRPGVPTAALRKLRRGGWVIRAELDLHGHTGDEARVALAAFLNRCHVEDRRCVRIIHGKGYGSREQAPVLKSRLNHWLREQPEVLAFCSSRPDQGGTGAVNVLLRSRR